VKAIEQIVNFCASLSLHRARHQRRGSFRDRAASPAEAHVIDNVAVHLDPHRDFVAAQRIATEDMTRRVRDLAEIARIPVVVEDDLLVER